VERLEKEVYTADLFIFRICYHIHMTLFLEVSALSGGREVASLTLGALCAFGSSPGVRISRPTCINEVILTQHEKYNRPVRAPKEDPLSVIQLAKAESIKWVVLIREDEESIRSY
jgi:hypothetical protein